MTHQENFVNELKLVLRIVIHEYFHKIGGKHVFLNQFIFSPKVVHFGNPTGHFYEYAIDKFNEHIQKYKLPIKFHSMLINEGCGVDYEFHILSADLNKHLLSVIYVDDQDSLIEGEDCNLSQVAVTESEWRALANCLARARDEDLN